MRRLEFVHGGEQLVDAAGRHGFSAAFGRSRVRGGRFADAGVVFHRAHQFHQLRTRAFGKPGRLFEFCAQLFEMLLDHAAH